MGACDVKETPTEEQHQEKAGCKDISSPKQLLEMSLTCGSLTCGSLLTADAALPTRLKQYFPGVDPRFCETNGYHCLHHIM